MKTLTQSLTLEEITSVAVTLEDLRVSTHLNAEIQAIVTHLHKLLVNPSHEQVKLELIDLYKALLNNNAEEHELLSVANSINELNGEPRQTLAEAVDDYARAQKTHAHMINEAIERTLVA